MVFKIVRRDYYTQNGWRLATFEEAEYGRKSIEKMALTNKWERARLLDGWISGPDYGFEMGNDFRGCMGYMLVTKWPEGADETYEMYEDVTLNKARIEVALLLSTEDWNYQVIYWVLNSSSGSKTMTPSDVSEGNLPLSDLETFKTMKSFITDLACELGKVIPVSENVAKKKIPGPDSVQDVLRDMIKIVKEQDANMSKLFDNDEKSEIDGVVKQFSKISLQEKWFGSVASQGGADWEAIAEAFWNFWSECYSSFILGASASKGISKISELNKQLDPNTLTTSQKNFIFATDVLLLTAGGLCYIIHTPLVNYTESMCQLNILCRASQTANGDPKCFSEMLRQNALWRCYDLSGNYDVLDKMVVILAKVLQMEDKEFNFDMPLIKRLLESGANPGATLPKHKNKNALHYAAKYKDETEAFEVAECLLHKCDPTKREDFANSADAKRRTSLHRAASSGHVSVCKLLLHYGATLDAQDKDGQTALHYAVAGRKSKVVDLFMENRLIVDFVDLKDTEGNSPVQKAINDDENENKIELVATLLSKSNEPETYFSEVDSGQLLRQCLVKGYVNIVKMLLEKDAQLPGGDVDDDGKTILHLATSCEGDTNARDMVQIIIGRHIEKENSMVRCDKRGRTVLHEAAQKGHLFLCQDFLRMNPELINSKDKDGRTVLHEAALKGHVLPCEEFLMRNPKLINSKDKDGRVALYDAVQGNHDRTPVWEKLLAAYSKKGRSLGDVIDRSGQTPFHIAASVGRRNILKAICRSSQFTREQMKRADFLGRTALHMAAQLGDEETVKILLRHGASPFEERDCDGRTALHYAVQAKTGREGQQLARLLLNKFRSEEEKLLFLWASAAGLGPADQNLTDSEVKEFLLEEKAKFTEALKKENLLQIAARMGHVEMTKELLTKGYQITDIQSQEWKENLEDDKKVNVEQVSEQIKSIAERGNDQPTRDDNLGRVDYAHGLAALLLNPYLKPPIAVGISGNWGMGKSSLMLQTEAILLKTVAELALLPGATSNFPGVQNLKLSKKGENIYERINRQVESFRNNQINEGLFAATMKKIGTNIKKRTIEKSLIEYGHDGGPFLDIIEKYEPEYQDIYKSLAVMDNREMVTTISHEPHSRKDLSLEGSVPSIITVQYNAWKYRNETEAMAGMAVEITREMEERMTEAQWLSTCWRNTWRKKKYNIWIEIIFPCILAIFLSCSFAWIVWLILDQHKLKKWAKTKYVCLPAAVVIIVWTLAKTVIGVIKPVSTQLMQYISFPDHTEKLGYQERVISDIKFLKMEIGRAPFCTFTALVVIWNFISALKWGIVLLPFRGKHLEETIAIPKLGRPSNRNLRIIVFVDDLDRCQESVILQVLSAINLVLAVCEISVVLGMDKGLIERAIMKKHGDIKTKSFKASQELADNYLQKIIQLPLDLPEPSEEQSKIFLEGQLGVFHGDTENKDSETEIKKNTWHRKNKRPQIGHFLSYKTFKSESTRSGDSIIADATDNEEDTDRKDATDSKDEPVHNGAQSYDLDVRIEPETQTIQDTGETGQPPRRRSETSPNTNGAPPTGNKNSSYSIPIREMLFVKYSAGEWDAICHFQKLATDCRKLPREWKRFLNYHRLVWNIFSISKEAKILAGWQVQLITWIFVCWEWKDNMNVLIEKWNDLSVLKTSESDGLSLRTIVEHLIEHESRDKSVVRDCQLTKGKPEELVKDSDEVGTTMNKKTEETVQTGHSVDTVPTKEPPEEKESRSEACKGKKERKKERRRKKKERMNERKKEDNGKRISCSEGQDMGSSGNSACLEKLVNDMKQQLHTIEESSRNELAELKNEIKELKEQVMKQQTEKAAKREAETNIKLQNWRRLRFALDRYDVSMEGIKAFQRFRFYCTAGHLPWPLPKDRNAEEYGKWSKERTLDNM